MANNKDDILPKEILSKKKDPRPLIKLNGMTEGIQITEEFETDLIIASIRGNLQSIIDDLDKIGASSDIDLDIHKAWCDEVRKVYKKQFGSFTPPIGPEALTALSKFLGRETSSIFEGVEVLTVGSFNISKYLNFRKTKASYLLKKKVNFSEQEDNIKSLIGVMKKYV